MCDGRHPNCARDGRANLALPLGTAGTDTECTLSHSTAVSNCPKTGVMATVSALNVVISFDPKSNNLLGPKSATIDFDHPTDVISTKRSKRREGDQYWCTEASLPLRPNQFLAKHCTCSNVEIPYWCLKMCQAKISYKISFQKLFLKNL